MKQFAFPRRFKSAASLLPTLTRNNRELLAFLNTFTVRFDADGSTVSVSPGSITSEAFIAASLENSWVNFSGGFRQAGYKKTPDGTIHIRGMVKDGSAAGADIFSLPSGYRPTTALIYVAKSAGGFVDMRIETDGDIHASSGGSTTWTTLDFNFQP